MNFLSFMIVIAEERDLKSKRILGIELSIKFNSSGISFLMIIRKSAILKSYKRESNF